MENEHTIAGLSRKRAELAGRIEHSQAELRQLVIDLQHIDAAIRLFKPDADLEAIEPKPWPPVHQAFRGEISRIVLDALRTAEVPMTTMALTHAVMRQRNLDPTDTKLARTMSKRVGACLRGLRRNTPIVSERGAADVMMWSLAT